MDIDYDGRIFRSLSNSPGGDLGGETLFRYRQRGGIVWATYEGCGVALGTLIARVLPDGGLDMRYQHVTADGGLKAGRCRSPSGAPPRWPPAPLRDLAVDRGRRRAGGVGGRGGPGRGRGLVIASSSSSVSRCV